MVHKEIVKYKECPCCHTKYDTEDSWECCKVSLEDKEDVYVLEEDLLKSIAKAEKTIINLKYKLNWDLQQMSKSDALHILTILKRELE